MIFRWMLWFAVTIAWTAGLVSPVSGPEGFGDTVEMKQLTRLLMAKGTHISIYAFWTVLTGWLQTPLVGRIFLLMFLMNHAVLTEWIQTFVPDRTGLLRDALLDQAGILIGVLLSWKWWMKG